ncbi:MAG TPA: hypothetical protein VFC21_01210 [Bryobacteraceae bacterium]|nr:hypothetical protein [Bryobacteraceae bacterium]
MEVRLRPTGPWRVGHPTGDKERVDAIYRSDALYSAITHAMRVLGWMEEWLDATARSENAPAVRFSSLFPFVGKTRLIAPPKTVATRMRLVPLEIARGATAEQGRWTADGASQCLIPSGSPSPFHISVRSSAAIDRMTGATEPHRTACLEFASNAGWWGVFDAVDSKWETRVKSAFRLLADSGFGGERSRGWGRSGEPSFSTASSLFPDCAANGSWWLLSLYSPHDNDRVDWSKGNYSVIVRGGWTDSPAGTGLKKSVRMIEEGSVLQADAARGKAVDVAPDGFAHPVYRSGFGLAVPLTSIAAPVPKIENEQAQAPAAAESEPSPPVEDVPATALDSSEENEPAEPVAPVDPESAQREERSQPAEPPENVSTAAFASSEENGQAEEPGPPSPPVEGGREG